MEWIKIKILLLRLWIVRLCIGQSQGYFDYANDVTDILIDSDIFMDDAIEDQIWHDWIDGVDAVECGQEIVLNYVTINLN